MHGSPPRDDYVSLDSAPAPSALAERPIQIGPDGCLAGILTTPIARKAGSAAPVIFLNAGVIHRVGPHRLHVNLARRLGAQGVASLRLDLSGIGDSRPVPGALSFRDSAVADIRMAMDWLAAEVRSERFTLFGLCSGADNALATAAVDLRVAGLVLLDPPSYVTSKARLRHALRRASALTTIEDVAALPRRAFRRLGGMINGLGKDDERKAQGGGREFPPQSQYRSQLEALIARGVSILSVYSGALGERYNHPDQLFELFPDLRGKLEREYFPTSNHMFTEVNAQAALMSRICHWIEETSNR